jgi:fused signal recognition particle receptor
MFSFFKKKPVEVAPVATPEIAAPDTIEIIAPPADSMPATEPKDSKNPEKTEPRRSWMEKLKNGLRKTGSSIATVFTGTQIDDALYEELEAALLMSDAGVAATNHLLADLKRRVKEAKATEPSAVKALLAQALADLLAPLQKPLSIGEHKPTVMMIAGVNGAGKTTSIGKLTWHLSGQGASVLLAAADTFRAAAKEQLAVWATRNNVEIISQDNADPAAVAFDAVTAGKARGRDVVMVDTAGRLPTQLHLMEEIAKIKRTIQKAWIYANRDTAGPPQGGVAPSGGSGDALAQSVGVGCAPHETLLVIDGNTGQNALAQVKAFDQSLQLTGLIITKLDGTAKGGVLAAIALWARERAEKQPELKPVAVYFIGVGEKLEDLETFDATEFSQALIT